MKKTTLLLAFLAIITFCYAQKKEKHKGNYSIQLVSVESPKDIQPGVVDSLTSIYEDAIIKIDWQYAVSKINFELTNKSDQTLKLIWDDAVFISTENESGRIFHSGVRYVDRENPQAPTSIYKNTTLSDLIAPTSNVYYVSGQYGGWQSKPIIPTMANSFTTKVKYDPELLGKTLRVALPIKMDDKTLEYVFEFKTMFLEKE